MQIVNFEKYDNLRLLLWDTPVKAVMPEFAYKIIDERFAQSIWIKVSLQTKKIYLSQSVPKNTEAEFVRAGMDKFNIPRHDKIISLIRSRLNIPLIEKINFTSAGELCAQ